MLARALPLAFLLASTSGLSAPAFAQSVGDVASPDVDAGWDASWRTGIRPAGDGFDAALAQRLQGQWAPNGKLHLRLGTVFTRRGDEALSFSNVFGEAMWQTHEDREAGFDAALRLDVQFSDLDRGRHRARATWLAQRDLNKAWRARINLSAARQFGPRASDDIAIGTGLLINRTIVGSHRLGAEWQSDSLSKVAQAGPIVTGPIAGPWSYQGALLFAASDRAAPVELRVFVNRKF
jgi:hypothetical protein